MNEKVKRSKLPFNGYVFTHLDYRGKVYTLRGHRFSDKQHDVTHKGKVMFVANVQFVKKVKICLLNSKNIPSLKCENHPQDLESFYKESGFLTVEAWLEALKRFRIQIPQYPKTRTFYLHSVEKIP